MLSPSDIVQLAVILLLASTLFFVAYSLPQIIGSSALLIMIPVQPVETRFGTVNVLLTFVIFLAMLLRRGDIRLPLLPQFLFLLFCYLLSMSFVDSTLYTQHAVYMLALVSAIMVFWIAHDLAYRYQNLRGIIAVFLAINVVVIIYSAIQLHAGPGQKVSFFGIDEISMIPSRWDRRLTGPFAATGVTSEFFVIMEFLILHQLLFAKKPWFRRALIALLGVNMALLIATGNRGGFLTLLGGSILFLWFLRKELGAQRVIRFVTSGIVILSMMSAIVISYTDFNRLYTRLEGTTFEEGIPDTRLQTWPQAWASFKERPIFGHGPRHTMEGARKGAEYSGYEYQVYPHNLYLFLLSTVGLVGFIAFMSFVLTPLFRCWKTMSLSRASLERTTFAKIGVVIMVIFLVDEIKIEFMRFALVDYWHFLFALFGVLVAVCNKARSEHLQIDRQDMINGPA